MTTQCEQIIDLFVDYLDGDLEPGQTKRLESHLDDCPQCIDFLDSYRRTGGVCKEALSVEMPAPLKTTLSEFLRSELQSPKP